MIEEVLAPAAVLIVWSLMMLFWMAAVRLPAIARSGIMKDAKPGGRGQDLEGVLPDRVNWKAHNYTHLMEQPTLFYAAVVILALAGASNTDVVLAWSYTVLRIFHSIWQAIVNTLPVRMTVFTLSTLMLLVLSVRALLATLG